MEHVLKIEVNGKYLTFYPNAKVKMVRKSPLFLNEANPGSIIYTFTIPSEPNTEILDYANLLFSNKKITTYDCNVFLKGNYYKKAKLDITGFTKETLDVRVRFDKPYFVEAGERNLRSFEYNNPTPFRYKPPMFSQYIVEFGYVNPVPTTNFDVEIQFKAPVLNYAIQSVIFNYSTTMPETLTEFITRIAKWFMDNIKKYGVLCDVVASNKLCFIDPYSKYGQIAFVGTTYFLFVLDATALAQFNVPINDASLPPALTDKVWNHNRVLAADILVDPQSYDYIFIPFYAPKGNSVANYNEVINDYNPDASAIGYMGDSAPSTWNNYNAFNPLPNLYSIFTYVHKELGILVDESFFDEELKTLTFYNNLPFSHNYSLPNFIDYFLGSLSFKYADMVPDITYKELTYGMGNMFCLVFDFESNDDKLRVIPRKKILQSPTAKNLTKQCVYNYFAKNEIPNYSLNYNWDNDESLVDERIKDKSTLVEKPNVDLKASLPAASNSTKFDLIKAFKENYFYYYSAMGFNPESWNFYMESLEGFNLKASDSINTDISTLFNLEVEHNLKADRTRKAKYNLPSTNSSINMFNAADQQFSQRLIFYRGLVDCDVNTYRASEVDPLDDELLSTATGQYPFGSYHNYDFKGNKCGNYSLAWNSPDGLVEVWWKQWIDFLNNTYPVTLQFEFSATEFMQLDMLEKIQVDNQHYLIDEMEVELNNEISLVTVKCFIVKTA